MAKTQDTPEAAADRMLAEFQDRRQRDADRAFRIRELARSRSQQPPVDFEILPRFFRPLVRQREALAEVLARAIELVGPVVDETAFTLRVYYDGLRPYDGPLGTAHRDQASFPFWDQRQAVLDGLILMPGSPMLEESSAHQSGPAHGTTLHLFEGAKLVALSWVGRWEGEGPRQWFVSLVEAQELEPEIALRWFNFMFIIEGLATALRFGMSREFAPANLEARRRELGVRAEQFLELIERSGQTFESSALELEGLLGIRH